MVIIFSQKIFFFFFLCFRVNSQNPDVIFENPIEDGLRVGQASQDVPVGHLKKLGEHGTPSPLDGKIAELSYMIGGKDFYEKFARERKPIVFRNITRNWRSTRFWKNESYLLEKYSDVLFDVEMGKVYNNSLNTRKTCLLYTSPSPRDQRGSRMPSSA